MFGELITTLLLGVLAYVLYQNYFGQVQHEDVDSGKKGGKNHKGKKNKSKNNTKNQKDGNSKVSEKDKVSALYKQHLHDGNNDILALKPEIDLSNENASLMAVYRGHRNDVVSLTWTVDQNNGEMLIASSSKDGNLSFWKLPSSKDKSQLIEITPYYSYQCPTKGSYYSLINGNISNNPDTSFISAFDKQTRKISIFQQKIGPKMKLNEICCFDYPPKASGKIDAKFMEIHPLGTYIGIGTNHMNEQNVTFYNPNNANNGNSDCEIMDVISFNNENDSKYFHNMFTVSSDGNYCVLSRSDNTLRIFEAIWHKPTQSEMKQGTKYSYDDINQTFFQNWKEFDVIKNAHSKSNRIPCALFSNDSRFVLSGSVSGELKLWEMKPQSVEMVTMTNIVDDLKGHNKMDDGTSNKISLNKAILSALNVLAVLCGNHNGKHIRRIIFYHIKHLNEVSSEHKSIKFKLLGELTEPLSSKGSGNVTTMKFSENGKYFAIGGTDFDVRVYKVPRVSQTKK